MRKPSSNAEISLDALPLKKGACFFRLSILLALGLVAQGCGQTPIKRCETQNNEGRRQEVTPLPFGEVKVKLGQWYRLSGQANSLELKIVEYRTNEQGSPFQLVLQTRINGKLIRLYPFSLMLDEGGGGVEPVFIDGIAIQKKSTPIDCKSQEIILNIQPKIENPSHQKLYDQCNQQDENPSKSTPDGINNNCAHSFSQNSPLNYPQYGPEKVVESPNFIFLLDPRLPQAAELYFPSLAEDLYKKLIDTLKPTLVHKGRIPIRLVLQGQEIAATTSSYGSIIIPINGKNTKESILETKRMFIHEMIHFLNHYRGIFIKDTQGNSGRWTHILEEGVAEAMTRPFLINKATPLHSAPRQANKGDSILSPLNSHDFVNIHQINQETVVFEKRNGEKYELKKGEAMVISIYTDIKKEKKEILLIVEEIGLNGSILYRLAESSINLELGPLCQKEGFEQVYHYEFMGKTIASPLVNRVLHNYQKTPDSTWQLYPSMTCAIEKQPDGQRQLKEIWQLIQKNRFKIGNYISGRKFPGFSALRKAFPSVTEEYNPDRDTFYIDYPPVDENIHFVSGSLLKRFKPPLSPLFYYQSLKNTK